MALSVADLLTTVRIPKGAAQIGFGISAQVDGRCAEMRVALQIARESNPGCRVRYRETQWEQEKDFKTGSWHHHFVVDKPGEDSYEYAVEAVKIDPRRIVACAFYEHNGKSYSVVATYSRCDGHLYVLTKEDGTCQTNSAS